MPTFIKIITLISFFFPRRCSGPPSLFGCSVVVSGLSPILPSISPPTDMYASGKYAGKLYFSSSADNAAKCKALGATAKGAHRPSRALPNTEAEAKALAKQLGMSWGGTGAYQNKGACE